MATTHSLAMYQLIAMTQQEAHQPPAVPFTIEQAHTVMQYHLYDLRAESGTSTLSPAP